ENTTYTIVLRDFANTEDVNLSGNQYVLTFQTGFGIRPAVILQTTPSDEEQDVDPAADICLTTDKPLDTGSIFIDVVEAPSTPIDTSGWTWLWNADDTQLCMTPDN